MQFKYSFSFLSTFLLLETLSSLHDLDLTQQEWPVLLLLTPKKSVWPQMVGCLLS